MCTQCQSMHVLHQSMRAAVHHFLPTHRMLRGGSCTCQNRNVLCCIERHAPRTPRPTHALNVHTLTAGCVALLPLHLNGNPLAALSPKGSGLRLPQRQAALGAAAGPLIKPSSAYPPTH